MILYQLIMGRQEFDPFEGLTTSYVHTTLEGAWKELGDTMEKMIFEPYRTGAITKIHDIDVDQKARHVLITYERIGFRLQRMVLSLYIQVQHVVA